MAYKVPFVNYPLQYKALQKEIDAAIKRILETGELILRQDVADFEQNLASFLGVKYVQGTNSGTDALIFSLRAAGIGPGDEVMTVSHTFFATIEAIHHCGATPILVEAGEDFTMDMDEVEIALTPKTKAIIPVHLNGRMCEMDRLLEIAHRQQLIIIEDAAQALGSQYRSGNPGWDQSWRKAGSFGLAGCFSFYPAKLLGAYGDAGAVATNDEKIAEKVKLLSNHGMKSKTEFVDYGFTSRLDNFQAAILNVKFKHLLEWIERRREIARMYNAGLSEAASVVLPYFPDERHFDVYQNYVLKAQNRDELAAFLKENGVETLIKDPIPLHHQPALGLSHFELPYTEQLAKEVISLPIYPELANDQIEYVIKCVKDFYQE